MESSKRLLVGVIGLPSAGKSTMINSLIGGRYLQSGVTRTTLQPSLVGTVNRFNFPAQKEGDSDEIRFFKRSLCSDDGVEFDILDLPGVSDTKDQNKEFDNLTQEYVTKCDAILWLTSAGTAFIHNYEKEYFEKIVALLEKNTLENGRLHQVAIAMSKFEFDDQPESRKFKKQTQDSDHESLIKAEFITNDPYEIKAGGLEASTKAELTKDIEKLYGKKYKLIKFSAYSRIYHKSSSQELKSVVQKNGIVPRDNFEFNLKWIVQDTDKKQIDAYFSSFAYNISQLMIKSVTDVAYSERNKLNSLLEKITEEDLKKKIVRFILSDAAQDGINCIPGLSTFLENLREQFQIQCYSYSRYDLKKKKNPNGILADNSSFVTFLTQLATSLTFSPDYINITVNLIKSNEINVTASKDKFQRLSRLLGKDSIHYSRLYYERISKLEGTPCPSNSLSEISPDLSQFDAHLSENPRLAVSQEFSDKVMMLRRKLWGDTVFAKENFLMILDLVKSKCLKSLFEKIDITLPLKLQSLNLSENV